MPLVQPDKKSPETPSKREYVNDFSGGLNTTISGSLLNKNEAQIATNVSFEQKGTIAPQKGRRKRYTEPFNDEAITGLGMLFKQDGTSHLVATSEDKVYSDAPRMSYKYSEKGEWETGTTNSYANLERSQGDVIVDAGTLGMLHDTVALTGFSPFSSTAGSTYGWKFKVSRPMKAFKIKWIPLLAGVDYKLVLWEGWLNFGSSTNTRLVEITQNVSPDKINTVQTIELTGTTYDPILLQANKEYVLSLYCATANSVSRYKVSGLTAPDYMTYVSSATVAGDLYPNSDTTASATYYGITAMLEYQNAEITVDSKAEFEAQGTLTDLEYTNADVLTLTHAVGSVNCSTLTNRLDRVEFSSFAIDDGVYNFTKTTTTNSDNKTGYLYPYASNFKITAFPTGTSYYSNTELANADYTNIKADSNGTNNFNTGTTAGYFSGVRMRFYVPLDVYDRDKITSLNFVFNVAPIDATTKMLVYALPAGGVELGTGNTQVLVGTFDPNVFRPYNLLITADPKRFVNATTGQIQLTLVPDVTAKAFAIYGAKMVDTFTKKSVESLRALLSVPYTVNYGDSQTEAKTISYMSANFGMPKFDKARTTITIGAQSASYSKAILPTLKVCGKSGMELLRLAEPSNTYVEQSGSTGTLENLVTESQTYTSSNYKVFSKSTTNPTNLAGVLALVSGTPTVSKTWSVPAVGIAFRNTASTISGTTCYLSSTVDMANATAWEFNGWMTPPTSGTYTFTTANDDNVLVYINNTLVVEYHGSNFTANSTFEAITAPTRTPITLTANVTVPVRIIVCDGTGDYGLALGWKKPGDSTFSVVPGSYFANPSYSFVKLARQGTDLTTSLVKTTGTHNQTVYNASADAITLAVDSAGKPTTPPLTGWSYAKEIRIPASNIDADLQYFPYTVVLTSSNFDFTKCKADGADIRFTDTAISQLKFERREHSASRQKAVYTVLVPAVYDVVDTVIYMFYGNANAYNTSIEAWRDQTGKALVYNGDVKLLAGTYLGGYGLYNILPNHDFENTGWTNGTYEASIKKYGNYSYKLTGTTGSAEQVAVASSTTIPLVNGNIYYASVYGYQPSGSSRVLQCYFPIAEPYMGNVTSVVGAWKKYSWRSVRNFTSGNYGFRLDFDNAYSTDVIYLDGAMLVNLTAIFGAGNEPTQAWCDANIEYEPKRVASFDGTGDYFQLVSHTDLNWGNSNFALEYVFNLSSLPTATTGANSYRILHSQRDGHMVNESLNMAVWKDATGLSLKTWFTYVGTTQYSLTTYYPFVQGVTYHVALVRNGATLTHYINGVAQATTYNISTNSIYASTVPLKIGSGNAMDATTEFNGWMSGIRFTKRARYTANFTPPTSFSIDGSDVVFCTNFDTVYDASYSTVHHLTGDGTLKTGVLTAKTYSRTTTTAYTTKAQWEALFTGVTDTREYVVPSVGVYWKGTADTVPPGATNPPANIGQSTATYFGWGIEGYVYCPTAGSYSFCIDSDDGGEIQIDGSIVSYCYNPRGAHTSYETAIASASTDKTYVTPITLTAGWHKIFAKMEQGGGGYSIAIGWKKPGDSAYSTILPSNYAIDILVDATGNGAVNVATPTGTTIVDTAKGNVRYFNGSSDYVTLNNVFASSAPFSMSFDYYPTRINASYDILYSGTTDNADLQLFFDATSKTYTTSIENVEKSGGLTLTSGNINAWHQLGITYNNTYRKAFVDGTRTTNDADTTVYTKTDATVRVGALAGSYYLQGYISGFRLSSIARADAWMRAEQLAFAGTLATIVDKTFSSYYGTGSYESAVIDLSSAVNAEVGTQTTTLSTTVPSGTSLTSYYKTSSDNATWGAYTSVPSPIPYSKYMRFKFDMTSNTDFTATPSINGLTLTYKTGYYPVGYWTSNVITLNMANLTTDDIGYMINDVTPAGTSCDFQIRTSADNVTWTDWTTIYPDTDLPAVNYLQYRVKLNANTALTNTPVHKKSYIGYTAGFKGSGSWVSQVYDMTSYEPTTIEWLYSNLFADLIATNPTTTVTSWIKTSYNNSDWSAWQKFDFNNKDWGYDDIAMNPYVQFKIDFASSNAMQTPVLDGFTFREADDMKIALWTSPVIDVSKAKNLDSGKVIAQYTNGGGTLSIMTRTSANGIDNWSKWQTVDASFSIVSPANNFVQIKAFFYGYESALKELVLSMDGNSSVKLIGSGLSRGAEYSFTTLRDKLFIANGKEPLKKWDGNTELIQPVTGTPPTLKYLISHHNRVWGVDAENQSRVRYSNILEPETWGAFDFIDFNPEDGDYITNILKYGQNVVISKQRSMALLTGNKTTNYNVSWLEAEQGCSSARGMCQADKYVVYVSQDGIRFTDLANSIVATERIVPNWDRINKRRLAQSAVVYWRNKVFVALPKDDSLVNNVVWVYDFLRNSWSIREGWSVSTWLKFNQYGEDVLMAGSSETGQIYQVDVTDYDDDIPVEYIWKSKDFHFNMPERYKLFRNIFLDIAGTSDATTLYVDLVVDGVITGTYTTTIPAGKGVKHTRRILPPLYGAVLGSAIAIQLRGRCGVQGITIEYVARGAIPGENL